VDARGSVLLLHAGVADSRMWKPQVQALESVGYRVIAPDLRGFGENPVGSEPFSHAKDVEGQLDGETAVVGNSLGGRVACELALHRPELVSKLVLVAPGLPGWEWSEEVRSAWASEEAAFEQGDYDAAAETSVRLWVDGPARSPGDVDPGVRAAVMEMVLRSYELELAAGDSSGAEQDLFDTPVADRLGEIRCPTLVLVGEHDVPDMQAIASRIAGSIEGAKLETIPDTAHLPSFERPDEFNAILLRFLAESR